MAAEGHLLTTARTETRYQQDDTNTIGLVASLFCGVGAIFACFAFVAICYRSTVGVVIDVDVAVVDVVVVLAVVVSLLFAPELNPAHQKTSEPMKQPLQWLLLSSISLLLSFLKLKHYKR